MFLVKQEYNTVLLQSLPFKLVSCLCFSCGVLSHYLKSLSLSHYWAHFLWLKLSNILWEGRAQNRKFSIWWTGATFEKQASTKARKELRTSTSFSRIFCEVHLWMHWNMELHFDFPRNNCLIETHTQPLALRHNGTIWIVRLGMRDIAVRLVLFWNRMNHSHQSCFSIHAGTGDLS